MFKKTLLPLAIAMALLPLAACSNNEPVEPAEEVAVVEPEAEVVEAVEVDPTAAADPMADAATTQTITELAVANPDLSILVEALQAAGLADTLAGAGPFTVFAPTNDAFAALLETLGMTKEELLANTDLLTSVLTYHVVPEATVLAADIPFGTDIATVNGATFNISDANVITTASGNTANITATDIAATNGVVHVIDSVLLPVLPEPAPAS